MMDQHLDRIKRSFEEGIVSVRELLEFDHIILDVSIQAVSELNDRLKNAHQIKNPYYLAENALSTLKGIREHDSLRMRYKRMFNQCLVLLVSHFGSAIRDLFESSVDEALRVGDFEEINRVKVDITLAELRHSSENDLKLGYLLASKENVSFQDMKSISRSFEKFFGIEIQKTGHVNNIILSQACRHAIVHSGARIDQRMLNQLLNARPRSVKDTLELNSEILFQQPEVEQIASSMSAYLHALCIDISRRFGEA